MAVLISSILGGGGNLLRPHEWFIPTYSWHLSIDVVSLHHSIINSFLFLHYLSILYNKRSHMIYHVGLIFSKGMIVDLLYTKMSITFCF